MPFDQWQAFLGGRDGFLVALTSIHWREAWKYGERAFRYCQHDVGHAIAALRVAAALFGWTLRLLPDGRTTTSRRCSAWTETRTVGMPRPKQPECLALVGPSVSWNPGDRASLVAAARSATWQGRANVLSRGHDRWEIIERVTEATRYPGQLPTPNSQLPTLESGVTVWKLADCSARDVVGVLATL